MLPFDKSPGVMAVPEPRATSRMRSLAVAAGRHWGLSATVACTLSALLELVVTGANYRVWALRTLLLSVPVLCAHTALFAVSPLARRATPHLRRLVSIQTL